MRTLGDIAGRFYNFVQLSVKTEISFFKKWIHRLHTFIRAAMAHPDEGFHDLAPTDKLGTDREYFKALDWALRNDRIRNIALSGPYGSGKSSIIRSYMKRHPGLKAVNISLAAFVEIQEHDGKPQAKEKLIGAGEERIEEGVLKQLFYKVDHRKIPRSRYRKLYRVSKLNIFLKTILFAAVIVSGIAYFMPEIWNTAVEHVYSFGTYYDLNEIWSWTAVMFFFLAAIWIFSRVLWILLTSYKVKEVNLADKAAIARQEENESIFDKNIDEIIYFFEETNYKVVFIEDLDRFNSPEIFVRLRELNTILNNYEKIRRRIVFVYAIRDDMFIDKDRTKFFDFMIPIVPVINSTNSNEKLLELLREDIDKNSMGDNRHVITQEYIMAVSPYIDDMRVLINIYNEFLIYKNTLRKEQNLELKDVQMMSLMIFKNLRPSDFAKLQMEKGVVKDAFRCKERFVKNQIAKLEEKKREISEKLKTINEDILLNIKELKLVILCTLKVNNEMPAKINVDGQWYDFSAIMGEEFDFEKLYNEQLIVSYSFYNRKTVNGIKALDEKAGGQYSYIERYRALIHSAPEKIEALQNEIASIAEKILKMRNISFCELCGTYEPNEILDFNYEDNLFLIFALRNGYIDEKYVNYINYFHANSITNSDMNFILNVRNHGGANYWSRLNKVDQVIKRLSVYEFEQKEIYNFDLLEYLLEHERDSEKCQKFIKQLSDEEKESWDFIKTFMELTGYENRDIFIQMLGAVWRGIWDYIYEDPLLPDTKKLFYLELLLENCSIEQIKGFDSNKKITDYFISRPDILQSLPGIETARMKNIIEALEIEFVELDTKGIPAQLLEWIFDNWHYKINLPMLQSIVKQKNPKAFLNNLKTKNYTVLCALNDPSVCGYIHENFEDYIRNVVLKVPTNKFESEEAVTAIIQKLQTNPDLCREVIKKEDICIKDFSQCCLEIVEEKGAEAAWIWDTFLDTEKVSPSWKNVLFYFRYFGLTAPLVDFISVKIDKLILDSVEAADTAFTKAVLLHNFELSVYRKLIEIFRLEEFDYSLGNFTGAQAEALLKAKYFKISADRYLDLKKHHPKLCIPFILFNKEYFFEGVGGYALDDADVEALLGSNKLTENEKKVIIDFLPADGITEKMADIIREMTIPLEKETVNAAWELLPQEKRYQLFLNQIGIFNPEELGEKFISLGGVYAALSDRTRRHTVKLFHSEYNQKLAECLCKKGYLTSADNVTRSILGKDEPYILCRVRQARTK